MSRRGKEFSPEVKRRALKRANGVCEFKGCNETKRLECHHILSLWFAAEYFPQLASHVLSSIENCCVVCHKHHIWFHNRDHTGRNDKYYEKQAKKLGARNKQR